MTPAAGRWKFGMQKVISQSLGRFHEDRRSRGSVPSQKPAYGADLRRAYTPKLPIGISPYLVCKLPMGGILYPTHSQTLLMRKISRAKTLKNQDFHHFNEITPRSRDRNLSDRESGRLKFPVQEVISQSPRKFHEVRRSR